MVENEKTVMVTAEKLISLAGTLSIPLVFKASYRKANRSRHDSFSGIGDHKALKILGSVSKHFDIPVTTDIHNPEEAEMAAGYVDILQIPAFLCRQTDLLRAAGKTGRWVNIKKGQFLSGSSMRFAADKVAESGNSNIILTERGNMYGYGDIIVDFRNVYEMKKINHPVLVDVTHSLQQPNRESGVSGGKPEMAGIIARAAIATGADGIFMETHPDPSKALSDGENMIPLAKVEDLLKSLIDIRASLP